MKNVYKESCGAPMPAIVATDCCIKGEIDTKSDIIVEGMLIGKLEIEGKLIIRSSGTVRSDNTECRMADIYGLFEGTLKVTEQLTIHEKGKVQGNIKVGNISIEMGGYFEGNCTFLDEPVVLKNESPQILPMKAEITKINSNKYKKEKK